MLPDAMRSVEIHFHALPGVDDGPETMEESLALLRAAAADGTGTVVVTPHVRGDFVTEVAELGPRLRELDAAAAAAGLSIDLRQGGELGHDMVGRLGQRELEELAQGPPGSRWLLVETPFEPLDALFHAATDELRDRGFGVVIGHPERSADATFFGSSGLRRELDRGALAQVNAQSITGEHGRAARDAAFELIRTGLVHAVSSDAHGPIRPPLLGEARARLLDAGVTLGLCRALTFSGPRHLLARGIGSRAAVLA